MVQNLFGGVNGHAHFVGRVEHRVVRRKVVPVEKEHRHEPVAPLYLPVEIRSPRLADHAGALDGAFQNDDDFERLVVDIRFRKIPKWTLFVDLVEHD